jgi:hypothetical protein
MSRQEINTGASANDNAGDPIRLAFEKCNNNFTELYANLTTYLPSPTGNSGKFLTTNGTTLSWTTTSFGNANISLGPTPPGSPTTKDLWFDDEGGRLYIYYDSTWIEASPPLVNFKLTVPPTPKGVSGDSQGEWTADYNYYYYCTANYTGNNANIWRRIAFINDNTWTNP